MLAQLNKFRTNPSSFQPQLEERKNFINQNNLYFSPQHPNKSIKTKEGRLPINELIGELFNDRQLNQIKENVFLSECARFIAESYCRENLEEHLFIQNIAKQIRGRFNSNSSQIFKNGKCLIGVGFKQQFEPLLSMLIDDGDKERNKRKLLLSNRYEYCGVGYMTLNDTSLACGVFLFAELQSQKSEDK